MLIEYYPSGSYIHKLDVRTKSLGFLALTLISFSFYSPIINFLLVLLSWYILYVMKTPLSRVKQILKPLIPIFVIMLVITGFTYPSANFHSDQNRKILFTLLPGGSVPFSIGGLLYGLTLVLRIFVMILASTIFTFSTSIEDILQLLKKIKVPHQLAFVIATGIRFIPTMQKKSEMIQEAQRARGAEIGKGGIVKSIKSYIPVLIPMIVDSLRMSDNLAIAMLNRGFGAMKTTTDLHEIRMNGQDYLICIGLILLIFAALWARSLNIGAL
ncbi:MAG: energy-coupling factor transporter transmembrane component T [Ignavibacteriales bacterium]|nr:energy-coupling factor transporter transmembrane component T [Ignavibacteriales bacterium]